MLFPNVIQVVYVYFKFEHDFECSENCYINQKNTNQIRFDLNRLTNHPTSTPFIGLSSPPPLKVCFIRLSNQSHLFPRLKCHSLSWSQLNPLFEDVNECWSMEGDDSSIFSSTREDKWEISTQRWKCWIDATCMETGRRNTRNLFSALIHSHSSHIAPLFSIFKCPYMFSCFTNTFTSEFQVWYHASKWVLDTLRGFFGIRIQNFYRFILHICLEAFPGIESAMTK